MKRLTLIPALMLTGPAWAHPASVPHAHTADTLPLVMGLALIATAAGVAAMARARARSRKAR